MPIWLFNPPVPHADPIGEGPDIHAMVPQRCGHCTACPRFWRLKSIAVGPTASLNTKAFFAQQWALSREPFSDAQIPPFTCHWTSGQIPGMQDGNGATWQLYYGSLTAPGGATFSGWIAIAHKTAASPPIEELAAWGLTDSNAATRWNCFGPNTLYYLDGQSAGLPGVPSSIILEPFYP